MNTKNNTRRQNTIAAIQSAYIDLCMNREDISTITVSDICKKAGINRTTFYSIYFDISDMRNSLEEYMMNEFVRNFLTGEGSNGFDLTRLFQSIKDNQAFCRLYFKLGFDFKTTFIENNQDDLGSKFFFDKEDVEYHIEFYAAGVSAIIRKWLEDGCPGPAERMSRIVSEEYRMRNSF